MSNSFTALIAQVQARFDIPELRRKFKDDGLERLMGSEREYYSTHGEYVPALAALLLVERAALKDALEVKECPACIPGPCDEPPPAKHLWQFHAAAIEAEKPLE